MKYLIIVLIIIFFFLLGQNNSVVNTNYNKVKYILAENFSNDNPLKVYSDKDFNEIRNKYHNWLIQNKEGKKTYIIPTSNTEYFNSFTGKITSFKEITESIIKSDFFNQVNKYNLDLGNNNLSGFLAYTEPSIKFKITFEIDEIIPEDLYIEYVVTNKNGNSYSNFTYYQYKVKDHIHIKASDVEGKLMKNKPIIFERPTNLDGQDNIYGNLLNNKKFEIKRELYVYDGSYNIEFKFYSLNKEVLKKIIENVEITLFNERLKLNETISPTNLDKSNSEVLTKMINVNPNYYGKKFLEYKIEEVKERLRLTIYPKDVKIIDDNLIISNDIDNYNYYKLVILGLLVLHEIHLKINVESKEIKDLNKKIEIYRDLLIPKLFKLNFTPNEEQKKNLEAMKAKLHQGEKKNVEREKDMNYLLEEYKNNNELNLEINLEQLDSNYENIIKNLLEKIESIPINNQQKTYSYRSVKLGGLEESTNILNLKPKPKDYFSYTFNNYKDPISRENIYSLLGNVSPRQYVMDTVKSIQSNFKNIFGKNRANLKDINFLSLMDDNLKNRLSTISKYSNEYEKENAKTKGEIISKDYEQYKIFNEIKNIITHFIEQINTNSTLYANLDDEGKLNTLRELVDIDMSKYKYGDLIIIDSNPKNKQFAPMETFSNMNDLNNKFQKKMNEVRKKINKYKKKSHNNIEMFSNMDTHKHTKTGKINFTGPLELDNPEWYNNQENKKIIQDYSFLDNDNKEVLMNSLGEVEKAILDSNVKIQSLVDSYAEFRPNIMSNNVKASIELAENDLNKANNEIDLQKYKNKEAEQEHRIKDVNNKVAELEKIQNKIYDSNKDDYNSIQSFSDGQILSINNQGNQEYSININGQCLGYGEEGVTNSKCLGDKNQLFSVLDIKNDKEYNNLLTDNKKPLITEFSNVKYPFQVVNPIGKQTECLTLNGNSVGVSQCDNSKFQRWEALKSTNDCGNI